MSWIMVDVETDGPVPGLYSMVSFGAVVVREGLSETFYGQCRPLEGASSMPEALAVSGHTQDEVAAFPEPGETMARFVAWLGEASRGRPRFISDNNGFDWMWVCWYLWRFHGSNPFGHSSQNLGSLYKGVVKDGFQTFKHLRRTTHTHHPVDDAIGNAEALLQMIADLGLKWKLD